MQSSFLAPLALILWFPVSLLLFQFLKRPAVAASISIIGAGILLPSGYVFDLPALPPIGRESVASIACLAALLTSQRKLMTQRKPLGGVESMTLVLIAAAFLTVLTNSDPRSVGTRMLQGLEPWDATALTADAVFSYGIPFYLGRVMFRNPRELRILLLSLVVGGLAYSVLVLWEVRMSPGLHHFYYGYHPAGFNMAKRELFFGWRPMVFVGHGLALSIFMLTTALGAAALHRGMPRKDGPVFLIAAGYLSMIVVLCNSIGTIVYAMFTVPVAAMASSRLLRQILILGSLLVFLYPTLRATDIFPTDTLVEVAAAYSEDRADSLKYRFDNEDLLLDQARERLLFGWGGYGRSRVYDLDRGKDITTTDGYWIIILGEQGVVGFLGIFGMLLLPVVAAVRATARRPSSPDVFVVLGAALIVVICAIDLLPNGAPTVRTVFCAGAIAGALQGWNGPGRKRGKGRRRRARKSRKRPATTDVPAPSDESPKADAGLGAGLLGSRREE